MKGYKNTTKTVYETESSANYAKGGKAMAKVGKVMGEFKSGTLHSGSKKGPMVKSPKQAIAIGLSEARKAGAKIPLRKAEGGKVKAPPPKAKPYDPVKDEPTSRPLTADQVRNLRNRMKASPPKPPAKRPYDPVLDEPTSRPFKTGGYVKKQAGGLMGEREAAARDMVGKAKGGPATAVHKHERNMHPGKPLTKLQKGGKVGC